MIGDPSSQPTKHSSNFPRREPSAPTKRSRFEGEDQAQPLERERIEGFSFGSISSPITKPSWMTRYMDESTIVRAPTEGAPAATTPLNPTFLARHKSTKSTPGILIKPVADSSVDSSRPAWTKRKSTFELPPGPTSTDTAGAPAGSVISPPSTSFLNHPTGRHKPNLSTSAIASQHQSQQLPASNSLLRPLPPTTPAQNGHLPSAPISSTTRALSSGQNRGATPSLTRLKGRGIVEEQLRKSKMRDEVDEMGVAVGSGEKGLVVDKEGMRVESWKEDRIAAVAGTPKSKWQASPLPSKTSITSSYTFTKPVHRTLTSAAVAPTTISANLPPSVPAPTPIPTSAASPPRPIKVKTHDELFPLRSQSPRRSGPSTPTTTPFLFSSPRINVKSFVQNVDSSQGTIIASPQFSQPSPRLGLGISTPSLVSAAAPIGLGKRKPPPSSTPDNNRDHPFSPPTKSPKSSVRGQAHSSIDRRTSNTPPLSRLQNIFSKPSSTSRRAADEREARKSPASIGRRHGNGLDINERLPNPWSRLLPSDEAIRLDTSEKDTKRNTCRTTSQEDTTPRRQVPSGLPSPTKKTFPQHSLPTIDTSIVEPQPVLKSILSPASLNSPIMVKGPSSPSKAKLNPSLALDSSLSSNDRQSSLATDFSPITPGRMEPPQPATATFKTTASAPVKIKVQGGSRAGPEAEVSKPTLQKQPVCVEVPKYELRDQGPEPERFQLKDEGWVDPLPSTASLVHVGAVLLRFLPLIYKRPLTKVS